METLELKINSATPKYENRSTVLQKNIDRLILRQDAAEFKIFYNNEFVPLRHGDQLCMQNTIITACLSEQPLKTVIEPSATLYEGKVKTEDYVELADHNLPLAALEKQQNGFGSCMLTTSTDPLAFLFQREMQIGLSAPASEHTIHSQRRQPLPLLKQHFNTPQITTSSPESHEYPAVVDIAPFEAEKSQANILHELGLSGEQEWNVYRANYLSRLPQSQKCSNMTDKNGNHSTAIEPKSPVQLPVQSSGRKMARSLWGRLTTKTLKSSTGF